MRDFPQRMRTDLSLTLRCCSHCMGDLEFRSEPGGGHYLCLQCSERVDEPASRISRLARIGGDLTRTTRVSAS